MNSIICNNCQRVLQRTIKRQVTIRSTATLTRPGSRSQPPLESDFNISSLLSQPTWSVRSLLPPSGNSPQSAGTAATTISPKTLHHLLRLSALPLPKTPAEESQMLATLSSQLHFVRAIQRVDTVGIAPLRVIRDETAQGLREQTVGLAQLHSALASEDVIGHARRPRRRRLQRLAQEQRQSLNSVTINTGDEVTQLNLFKSHEVQGHKQPLNDEEDWDIMSSASETAAQRYFVVRSGGTDSLAIELAEETN